jgi:hypothetical protein
MKNSLGMGFSFEGAGLPPLLGIAGCLISTHADLVLFSGTAFSQIPA